jgi:hypothetical protein
MNISDTLFETMKFCFTENLEFRLITGGPDQNDYQIDQDNKIVTITIIDDKDVNLEQAIDENLKKLKQIFK